MLTYEVRVQVWALVAAGVTIALVVELIRRRKLNEWYSLLWLATAAAVGVFAAHRRVQFVVADWFGIQYPPLLILAILLFLVMGISLLMSVALTRLELRTRRLAQRLALLEMGRGEPPSERAAPRDGEGQP